MSSSGVSSARRERVDQLAERIGRELATKTVLFHHAVAIRLGLSVTDLKCMDLLHQTRTPLTGSNLVRLTGLTGGAITGVADRLEAAGLLERVRDPLDRRRCELRPTPAGQREIGALFAPLAAAMSELCSRYTDDELDVLISFLTDLSHVMDDQTDRLRGFSTTGDGEQNQ